VDLEHLEAGLDGALGRGGPRVDQVGDLVGVEAFRLQRRLVVGGVRRPGRTDGRPPSLAVNGAAASEGRRVEAFRPAWAS
jgi:hypothetical protein